MIKQLRYLMAGLAVLVSAVGTVLVCALVGASCAAAAWGVAFGFQLAFQQFGWPGPLAVFIFLLMLAENIRSAAKELMKETKR